MASCRCGKHAVFLRYCKEHFNLYFESKVKATLKRFKLLKKTDKVAVAVSGGKDSLTTLYLLKKLGYDVTAIAIDEGIKGYRKNTLDTMKKFCRKSKIKYHIYSFKKEFSKDLDEIKGEHPCTVCGVLRRYLLNKYARGYNAIATGHNLDDESQGIVMNLLKNNIPALMRSGPVAGSVKSKAFTRKVKPLYFCMEKEVMAYSFLNDITTDFNECPHVTLSFRMHIRDALNELEAGMPGSKKNILEWQVSLKKKQYGAPEICRKCGENSSQGLCRACQIIERIKCS